MPRPAGEAHSALVERAVALAIYVALTAWWLWPLPAVWQDHSAYFVRDVSLVAADWYLLVWILAWGTHALTTSPASFFGGNIFFPSDFPLAYSEHLLGYQLLFAPPYLLTGNAILAANLLIFATFPLCAVATYALARRWVDAPAALVAGLVYAFAPFRYAGIGHFHLLGTFFLPLALLCTERFLDRGRLRDAAAAAACLALQCLSSFYLAYAALFAYGAYLVATLSRDRLAHPRRLATLLGFVVVALVPVAGMSIPYVVLRQRGLIPSFDPALDVRPMGLLPGATAHNVRAYLTAGGPSVAGYVLTVVALLPPWRAWAVPVRVGGALALFGIFLAFGPTITILGRELWSPYEILARLVPGLDAVRLPTRFVVVAQLGFALLAGVGLARLRDRVPSSWRAAATALACGAVLYGLAPRESLPVGFEITRATLPPVYDWLAKNGNGRAVLELPPRSVAGAARRMYDSTFHWQPIVEGYSAYPPTTPAVVESLARGLPSEAALQELVDHLDVGWIVVHRAELDDAQRAAWQTPPAGLVRAGEFDADAVFAVTQPVANDRRDRLRADARTSFGGAPLGPLSDCAGAIRLAEEPLAAKLRAPVVVPIEIANATGVAWPGPSVAPAHAVWLRTSVRRDDGTVIGVTTTPVPADVPAGASTRGRVGLPLLMEPGRYTLRIEAFQRSRGMLQGCGLAPLVTTFEVS